ncbi:MAG: hypothetical protein EOO38_16200, partial [Cytophagaceae bacterium]
MNSKTSRSGTQLRKLGALLCFVAISIAPSSCAPALPAGNQGNSSPGQGKKSGQTFVYIPAPQASGINQFRIGSSGELVALKPPLALADQVVTGLVVDNAGRYAYVLDGSGHIFHCDIAENGVLKSRKVTNIPGGLSNGYLLLDQAQRMVYLAGNQNQRIERFSMTENGVLKPLTPIFIPEAFTTNAELSPSSKLLIVTYARQKDMQAVISQKSGATIPLPIHYDVFRLDGTTSPV